MKYLIIFIISCSFLFGFDVFFDDYYQKTIFPDKKAILLETKKPIQINYSPKIYTKKGIVLLNYDSADQFVRNDLYFNGNIKDIKIGILNIDKIRNKIISRLNKYYKNCKLKKIEFKDDLKKNIFFTPTTIIIHSQVTLDCK
jgi:hypothetical protein